MLCSSVNQFKQVCRTAFGFFEVGFYLTASTTQSQRNHSPPRKRSTKCRVDSFWML